MSRLTKLKSATSLHDLAMILGYTAKGLAYAIHGIPDSLKYTDFLIKKRSGGNRTISAPVPELKRVQKHLAQLLNDCITESDTRRGVKNTLSHGFRPKHSIMTNAMQHRKHRYVFNVDLHDFFGTINFGRVWRFLEKNREFKLNSTIARTIAQIACHKTTLPQGSPCSPVLSNLIAHIVDISMVQLAARVKCHYSRYADDLTFSTNEQRFPSLIATRIADSTEWVASPKLIREIKRCGFELNTNKTRMQFKNRRQEVTGIVVNSKINVSSDYVRNVRAMTNSYLKKGEYYFDRTFKDENGSWQKDKVEGREAQLRGMLSFIDSVRLFEQKTSTEIDPEGHTPRVELKSISGHSRLYRRFLFFTKFYQPSRPLIICEGKTDNIYIRCALRSLATAFPELAKKNANQIELLVNFFHYTKTTDRILHLAGGTGDLSNFIARYGSEIKEFREIKKRHPIIILIDNDSGSTPLFGALKKATGSIVSIDGSQPYYSVCDNLYVVPIPKLAGKDTTIEHYFSKKILNIKLGGKIFSGTDKFDPATQYGKHLFAEYVIKKNFDTINFSKFKPILMGIKQVLDFHDTKP